MNESDMQIRINSAILYDEKTETVYASDSDCEYEVIRIRVDNTSQLPAKCNSCEKSFMKESSLARHKLLKHIFENYDINSGGESEDDLSFIAESKQDVFPIAAITSNLKTVANILPEETPSFTCSRCSRVFLRKQALMNHFKVHRIQKENDSIDKSLVQTKPKCTVCSVTFTRNQAYMNHMKIHKNNIDSKRIKLHQCPKCPRAFLKSQRLSFHMMSHQYDGNPNEDAATESMPYKCQQCPRTFTRNQALANHRKLHVEKPNIIGFGPDETQPRTEPLEARYTEDGHLQCPKCPKTYSKTIYMNLHLKTHLDASSSFTLVDGMFQCNICAQLCSDFEELATHLQCHRPPFNCTQCNKVFTHEGHLSVHMDNHAKRLNKKYPCNTCGKEFSKEAARNKHAFVHSGDQLRPYLCTICGKRYRQSLHLSVHMRIHSGDKPHLCSFCGKSFSMLRYLIVHQRSHTKEKPFKCQLCPKAFVQNGNLVEHIRTHTGQKPHVCKECGKRFSHYSGLTQHLRFHSGVKKFVCIVCDKRFVTGGHYRDHMRTHSGEKPHVCQFCGKTFRGKSTLTVHLRTHSGVRPFKCNSCGKGFIKNCNLKQHLKTHKDCSDELAKDK